MHDRIRGAFDAIQAPERLKRATVTGLRKRTFDYGRNGVRRAMARRRLAAGLLTAAVVLSGAGLWYMPAASIAVDINPSIELKVNALDRVIALEGRNSDGIALAQEMHVTGMTYDDAMQRVLLSKGLEPYLEQGSMIAITVVGGGTETHAERMLSKVLCRAYAIAEEENVLYCQVDWETVKAAREHGLCIPRYLARQRLKETDPSVTVEDVRALPKAEVRALAQILSVDNPCGES